ncbi:MAG: hypothetical protein JTT12_05465 [Candidatus Brockarchaeota archaeon]|nr:hypothetical protein [Candidatus Brockarchaeota archaeon]
MLSQIRSQASYVKSLIVTNNPKLGDELKKLSELYSRYLETLPPDQANLSLAIVTSYGAIQISRKDIPKVLALGDPRMPYVVGFLAGGYS